MKLELDGQSPVQSPTRDDIANAIYKVDDRKNHSFCILANEQFGNMSYIQTTGNRENGFTLEYCDGSPSEHYRSTNQFISQEQILEAFQRYNEGNSGWNSGISFGPVSQTSAQGGAGKLIVAIIAALILLGGAAAVFFMQMSTQ